MSEGEYDEERLWAAIRGAQLEDYVKAQPDGIRTVISSKTISKGEGQKINLARALYRKEKLLILDEVTSAMDPVSEQSVVSELKQRVKAEGLIVLFISHRVVPLIASDRVYYIQEGLLAGADTHENLYAGNESYRQMLMEAE